ncbi:similar to Saccharomyces cerevisiae YPR183W DPM1 Dolichol phosphate mannose (Dol-P- Man) synthase of the ER membrane, catalyzes the formation of Dol-P-Man from Dol-P and GDP-Man [Maudiozyma barnettii]|uniref:Dolichol-phosphate mannosyltransferase subunit 1 n=1 Tax=Maudiozyma barnettii TaxID=61262 RepID=A0A8H2VE42_9SACH|nr:dolichyl-phosphate beta-D-mannosyltransferase [Kazachstania barnettii]CAB4253909.1 similar to Saccharomyces cerevisiae YPR183W DPM1 Dolichol phosphate mannose (Dol-P- Man) synthase of the ER membrane, catalyzes the formation of Dol-P-Man from Dol-P and GDP-Man [Kazachstania barnettii]CAD1781659.1 similar to Saccharomyces cerevisiae YPR183W DPM1 Dolichol phosphate mannose (Dol-P- Man) synthase of the ER membrane, catalyzes the formation of Dol-P-Man from Dol-P and GDP-Man [Kazachstania barnetti
MSVTQSVIVPAYKEKLNIKPLTTRLFAALGNDGAKTTELIFVDDNSQDGSVDEVEELKKEGYNVRIIVRTTERGLSSAVLRGFYEAEGDYLICMDADLQHPPESVPSLFDNLKTHPFVIGTRYAPGVGIDKDWPLYRRVISSTARMMARPLTTASDPMSGFFGLQKKYLIEAKDGDIDSKGFKIALELLAKLPLPADKPIGEIPFSFGVRTEGESKLSGKVIIQYLEQLKELYVFKFGANNLVLFLLFSIILVLYILYQFYSLLF